MRRFVVALAAMLVVLSTSAFSQGADPFAPPVWRVPAPATERVAEPEIRERVAPPSGPAEGGAGSSAGQKPTLGLVVRNLSREDAELFGVSYHAGARVIGVVAGSPADAGGIRIGDVIMMIGEEDVPSVNDLVQWVGARRVGDEARLRLMRDGRLVSMRIVLAGAKDTSEAERLHTEARKQFFDTFGDRRRANELFRAAATLGHPAAMAHMGWLLTSSNSPDVPTDYAAALRWYQPAARAGNAQALGGLCWMHYNGSGVQRDYRAAYGWCLQGALAGDTGSVVTIGFMYEKGLGLTSDLTRAGRFYARAAEAGDAQGMINLGVLNRDGRGFPASKDVARRWFTQAKEAGAMHASTYLNELDAKPAQARKSPSGANPSRGSGSGGRSSGGQQCRPVNDFCQRCGGHNDPNNTCYTVACNFRMQCN